MTEWKTNLPVWPPRRRPFQGYQRPRRTSSGEAGRVSAFGHHGLSLVEIGQAEALWQRARARGPLRGPYYAARVAGIVSAVRRGAIGDPVFGRRLRAIKGGRMRARLETIDAHRERSRRGGLMKALAVRRARKATERARWLHSLTPRQREALTMDRRRAAVAASVEF